MQQFLAAMLILNAQTTHLASDFQCPACSKEMEFLKNKADDHLPITEVQKRYSKASKSKSYATIAKPASESFLNAIYVTKTDLEQTLKLFFPIYIRTYHLNYTAANTSLLERYARINHIDYNGLHLILGSHNPDYSSCYRNNYSSLNTDK